MEEICDSLINCGMFLDERKGCRKKTAGTGELLYIGQHIPKKQNEKKKSKYGVDWRQKGIGYGPTKLDNRLSQNVQDIRRSHNV